jgi:hypothetical protein
MVFANTTHIIKPKVMKKLVFAFAVLFLSAVSITSCKSKEKCDAYSSKADKVQTSKSY